MEANKVGRPRETLEGYTEYIQLYVTRSQKEQLVKKTEENNVSLNKYIRKILFPDDKEVESDAVGIKYKNLLDFLGQKNGAYIDEVSEFLGVVNGTARRILKSLEQAGLVNKFKMEHSKCVYHKKDNKFV